MSDNILDLRMDAEFEEKIKNASFEQIKEMMKQRAVDLRIFKRENDPSILTPVEQTAAPETVSVTVEVKGVKTTFTGTDADDLDRQQIAYFRALEAAAPTTEPTRGERGRFTPAEAGRRDEAEAAEVIRQADLKLQLARGDIDTATYLTESGAMANALEAIGVSVDVLKHETADRVESARYIQSWTEATSDFLKSPSGSDWPGTPESLERAKDIITRLSQTNPNMERESSKVDILSHVWAIMKRTDAQAEALANAKTPQEIDDAIGKTDRAREGMLNRSSGVFGR